MAHLSTQAAHDGRHHVDLRADHFATAAELLLNARGNQQQRHVEAVQIHFGQLLIGAKAMVANDNEQRLLEVRRLARLLEELAQGPVRIAHGGQVLVRRTLAANSLHRQVSRQGVWRVVGERLQ